MINLGQHSYLIEPHYEYFNPQVYIGKFCSIADKVTFCGEMNHAWVGNKIMVNTYPFSRIFQWSQDKDTYYRGEIRIGSDVWIGTGAFIHDGVTIGDGVIIGAQTVVAKDIPSYAVAVGNPVQVKHFRFTPEQIIQLLKIKWWDWSLELIKSRLADFADIEIFLEKYYAN